MNREREKEREKICAKIGQRGALPAVRNTKNDRYSTEYK